MSLFPVAGTPPAVVLTREGNSLFSLLWAVVLESRAPRTGLFFWRFPPVFVLDSLSAAICGHLLILLRGLPLLP